MNIKYLITGIALVGNLVASAKGIGERILATDTILTRPMAMTLAGAAMSPLRHDVSLSTVNAGYARSTTDRASTTYLGKGNSEGFFDASTYLTSDRNTITGHASYCAGTVRDVQGCEVSDPGLVYPFFTADETGGDLRREVYSFGGAYASKVRKRWLWGARLNYKAIRADRDVDPRPRNTTGRLAFAAGAGYTVGGYVIAIDADAMKYSQSHSIMFVSELGEIKIYQTTGLGTHYHRFAGASKATSFNGWERGISLALAPTGGKGAFASLRAWRFTLDKILTDLSNLPLNHIGDNTITAQTGWRQERWTVAASLRRVRRTGSDNIFGEAVGNVYPQIASYATFRRKYLTTELQGAVRTLDNAYRRLDFFTTLSYNHTGDHYLDPSAPRSMTIKGLGISAGAQWTGITSRRILVHGGAAARWQIPLSSAISGADSDFFLDRLTAADFYYATHRNFNLSLSTGGDYMLNDALAVGLRIAYSHRVLAAGNRGNGFTTSISINF